MVDFKKLVEGLLVEQAPSNETQNIQAVLKNNYNSLKQAWNKKYEGVPFATEDEINSIVLNVVGSLPRFTIKSENYPTITNIYPLIDLVASLYLKHFKGKQKPSEEEVKVTINQFVDNLVDPQKNPSDVPLDFQAVNQWTKKVKSDFLSGSKVELGKLRLESLPKDLSFYQTIYELLKVRRQALNIKFPQSWKQIPGEQFIKDVFLNISSIISGKVPVKNEQIEKIYDASTTQNLINLSLAAYKLYVQQVNSNTKNEKLKQEFLKDSRKYEEFLGARTPTAKPLSWEQEPTAESFSSVFELAFKNLLQERDVLPAHYKNIEVPKQEEITSDENKEKETSQTKPFESPRSPGEFIYNIQNLDNASNQGLDEAKNFKSELENFANYLKKETETDWSGVLSGATQVAKGLSLGT